MAIQLPLDVVLENEMMRACGDWQVISRANDTHVFDIFKIGNTKFFRGEQMCAVEFQDGTRREYKGSQPFRWYYLHFSVLARKAPRVEDIDPVEALHAIEPFSLIEAESALKASRTHTRKWVMELIAQHKIRETFPGSRRYETFKPKATPLPPRDEWNAEWLAYLGVFI